MLCKNCANNNNIKCNICGIYSIYTHCVICNEHHINTNNKSHCCYCGMYDHTHTHCNICNTCSAMPKFHCYTCNKCYSKSMFHCNKCNKCHLKQICNINIKCNICNKSHTPDKVFCQICNKCHEEDYIHCIRCNKIHWEFINDFCKQCNKCVNCKHHHCEICSVEINQHVNINENRIVYAFKKITDVVTQVKVGRRIYDLFLPIINIYIEYDGEYHFFQVSNWNKCGLKYNTKNVIQINYIDIKLNKISSIVNQIWNTNNINRQDHT